MESSSENERDRRWSPFLGGAGRARDGGEVDEEEEEELPKGKWR